MKWKKTYPKSIIDQDTASQIDKNFKMIGNSMKSVFEAIKGAGDAIAGSFQKIGKNKIHFRNHE